MSGPAISQPVTDGATGRTATGSGAVHMVGIGGAGMSALARLYLQQGRPVSGSDEEDSAALRDLRALGATVYAGHAAAYLGDAALVVYSSAVPATNPELQAARERGLPAIKHAAALADVFQQKRGIAVAGTHGKTTTTSMIAFALDRCGQRPSFQVGGELVDLDTSARWTDGAWMVIEADEFDRRFLAFRPEVAVVTNVEPDHFECYDTVEAMEDAFAAFLGNVSPGGAIIACAEEPRLARLLDSARGPRIIRYGIQDAGGQGPGAMEWVASEVVLTPDGSRAVIRTPDGEWVTLALALSGRHNVLNALAAIVACALAGVPAAESAAALAGFHGARRRMQLLGDAQGILVYEDYAHHPTEVRETLAAVRPLVPPGGRLWAIFQPHLYVRTEMLFDEFTRCFASADAVVLTDVYSPSGREPAGQYRGSRELVAAMNHPNGQYRPGLEDVRRFLLEALRPGDLALVMGAGPVTHLAAALASDLAGRGEALHAG